MKITKYAQSCGLIETKQGKRILVDPGTIQYEEKLFDEEWVSIDYVFVTHKHDDHCNIQVINKIIERDGAKLYTIEEVYESNSDLIKREVIKEGDVVDSENGVKVEVVKAVHGWIPIFKGNDKFPEENVGLIIDDGDKRAYFTSDTLAFDNDYKCDIVWLPVCGHVAMDSWTAAHFAKMVGAKYIIPVHGDNPAHYIDWERLDKDFKEAGVEYKKLEIGESIEI